MAAGTERTSTSGNNVFSEHEYQAMLSHAELGVLHTSHCEAANQHAVVLHDLVKDLDAGVFFTADTLKELAAAAKAAKTEADAYTGGTIITRQFDAALAILPYSTRDVAVAAI